MVFLNRLECRELLMVAVHLAYAGLKDDVILLYEIVSKKYV
jgi:hypothetical protein